MPVLRYIAQWFSNYENRGSIGSRLRARRTEPLLRMIDAAFREKGSVDILDVGGTRTYWNIVDPSVLSTRKVTITILNLPGSGTPADDDTFKYLEADGCDLSVFGNRQFDIAHSNSVIEHVGDWGRMVQFANEILRVSNRCFVQTPNYWFPVEPHCMTPLFHWLPRPTRVWLVRHVQLGHWPKAGTIEQAVKTVDSASLLSRPMFHSLFPNATIFTERVFCLPKSFIALRD